LHGRGSFQQFDASIGQAVTLHANGAISTQPKKYFGIEQNFRSPLLRAEHGPFRDLRKPAVNRGDGTAVDEYGAFEKVQESGMRGDHRLRRNLAAGQRQGCQKDSPKHAGPPLHTVVQCEPPHPDLSARM
jgi:hypothetical protein